MSYRIQTKTPNLLTIHYTENVSRYFNDDDELDDVGPSLVLDDGGNQEAFVLIGSPEDIGNFARNILDALPVVLTEAEQTYLTHICEMHEYDVDAGDIGRAASGWAWFVADEHATGYDLTNQQEREITWDT
jgi:hypothetical protein